jgi:hypothetical protein
MPISKFQNIDWSTGVTAVDNIAKANIASITDIDVPSSGPLYRSTIYNFNGETAQTNPASDWAPSAAYAADGWVNGVSAVNGTTWTAGVSVKGFNCDFGTTPSTFTGPAGGMTSTTNGTPTAVSTERYVYKETSSSRNLWDHIVRTPGYNFSTLMTSTANNLRMVMWYHAYGNTTWSGDLFNVYVDTALTSNAVAATNLYSLPAAGNTMAGEASPYIVQNIDLNSYRTIPATYYFYILLNPQSTGTSYRHDIAIDTVYFEEY